MVLVNVSYSKDYFYIANKCLPHRCVLVDMHLNMIVLVALSSSGCQVIFCKIGVDHPVYLNLNIVQPFICAIKKGKVKTVTLLYIMPCNSCFSRIIGYSLSLNRSRKHTIIDILLLRRYFYKYNTLF